jgi:hypothetical protein
MAHDTDECDAGTAAIEEGADDSDDDVLDEPMTLDI